MARIGGAQDGAQEANEPREVHGSLTYRQECAVKNEVLESPWCRTLCFHVLFLAHVSRTPNFYMLYEKNLLPGRQSTGPRRDHIHEIRSKKHRVLETR